nr:hypothetical protein [uncultured Mediterranean phage uvMED]|tara:strand:- start:84 stop:320 length:237 start_codon:yes stop_codon:yes gene_type:complete
MELTCNIGVSRYAKDVHDEDELVTIGHKSIPIIAITRAFGKTTITFGDENNPKQKVFANSDNVVVNEKVYKTRIKAGK